MLNKAARIIWPRVLPVNALYALLGACLVFCGSAWHQLGELGDLQKFYAPTYLRLLIPLKQKVTLVEVRSPRGALLAIDPWVKVEGTPKQPRLFITREGMALGYDAPFLVPIRKAEPTKIGTFLREEIYGGSLFSVIRFSAWTFGFALVVLLPIGMYYDWRHAQLARHGVQLRGPRLLSEHEAANEIKGDGIAILLRK